MTVFERIGNADRRWWFFVLTLFVAIPVMFPMGLPVSITGYSRQFAERIDKVQAGDVVLLSTCYTASSSPDVHAGAQAVFRVLMKKGAKVVLATFSEQGDVFSEYLVLEHEAKGKTYGVDFVNLGFIAGQETALAAFAADVSGLMSSDYRGISVASLPILESLETASDFALTILVATGTPGAEEWTRQITMPYKVESTVITSTNASTRVIPYVQSGQVSGMLIGLRGSAEYEGIARVPGTASAGMDAQSLGHLLFLIIIVIANLAQFTENRRVKGPAGDKGVTAK